MHLCAKFTRISYVHEQTEITISVKGYKGRKRRNRCYVCTYIGQDINRDRRRDNIYYTAVSLPLAIIRQLKSEIMSWDVNAGKQKLYARVNGMREVKLMGKRETNEYLFVVTDVRRVKIKPTCSRKFGKIAYLHFPFRINQSIK